MKISRLYDYEKLNRITHENGSRFYVSPNGTELSSVTTILAATANKPELEEWRNRVGLVEANRIRDEATGLGTLMHTHLENYVEGKERPGGTNFVRMLAKNMADQIINRGLINVDEVWGMEESLYYPELWAGTADLCGLHKGEPAIMDYKTTRVMKTEAMIRDYLLQVVAYALGHNEIYHTNIKKGVIFMVSRNLEYQEFIVDGNLFKQKSNEWLNRVETFFRMKTA